MVVVGEQPRACLGSQQAGKPGVVLLNERELVESRTSLVVRWVDVEDSLARLKHLLEVQAGASAVSKPDG